MRLNAVNMKNKVPIEKVVPKEKISSSIQKWMVKEITEWAAKETRTFSNMTEHLLWEALQTRKGLVKSETIYKGKKYTTDLTKSVTISRSQKGLVPISESLKKRI